MTSADKAITERILTVLRPYASGRTLRRGDLVIPQAEVPRTFARSPASYGDRRAARRSGGSRRLSRADDESRLPSIQDPVADLKRRFLILTLTRPGCRVGS
jgi:hypothetical protein